MKNSGEYKPDIKDACPHIMHKYYIRDLGMVGWSYRSSQQRSSM